MQGSDFFTKTDFNPGVKSAITDQQFDSGQFIKYGSFEGVSPTTPGKFANDCILSKVDAADGAPVLYENVGSTEVPNFLPVGASLSTEITGQFLGSSDTYAGLPTADALGDPASNGDWAVLTQDDGGNVAGIYVYDGVAFQFVIAIEPDTQFIGPWDNPNGTPADQSSTKIVYSGENVGISDTLPFTPTRGKLAIKTGQTTALHTTNEPGTSARDTWTVRREDNMDEVGISFQNAGLNYDTALYQKPVAGANAFAIATIGNEMDPTALGDTMLFNENGQITMPEYGTGSFDAVNQTRNLSVDADGNVIETSNAVTTAYWDVSAPAPNDGDAITTHVSEPALLLPPYPTEYTNGLTFDDVASQAKLGGTLIEPTTINMDGNTFQIGAPVPGQTEVFFQNEPTNFFGSGNPGQVLGIGDVAGDTFAISNVDFGQRQIAFGYSNNVTNTFNQVQALQNRTVLRASNGANINEIVAYQTGEIELNSSTGTYTVKGALPGGDATIDEILVRNVGDLQVKSISIAELDTALNHPQFSFTTQTNVEYNAGKIFNGTTLVDLYYMKYQIVTGVGNTSLFQLNNPGQAIIPHSVKFTVNDTNLNNQGTFSMQMDTSLFDRIEFVDLGGNQYQFEVEKATGLPTNYKVWAEVYYQKI